MPLRAYKGRCPTCGYDHGVDMDSVMETLDSSSLRQHSVTLNRTVWRMLELLGEVGPKDDERFVDHTDVIDRFFARVSVNKE